MTVHIGAQTGDFAKTVLMPGDPLRAKFIAERYLANASKVTEVRGMMGYTGTYKGKKISVMGSGMGMPSMGIYSYELYTEYDVDNIIRIGSCGSFQEDVKVRDIVFAMGACTNSNFASQYGLPGTFSPIADYGLLSRSVEIANTKNIPIKVGNALSSDIFYDDNPKAWEKWSKMGVMVVEMEAAALYMNAARLNKNALAILTVSDSLVTGELTTAQEREKTFTDMMEIALELA
ncbi:purine-nucleoside phosphorylase [Alkalibacter saccharofermentans]|uniref:Purine nucleoside phosphorylase DeoD-type n=1 Tax=Alkalibacter saccharofermentans DSM 14828 TaxID=1120975 RepID=A0A1M4TFG1_9FIRM|nr:purine-nucleoside phosphorylase [Alkalibacter saccharofermentans]SHE43242.1 purine-nucleoside phosphorylase [Alkalibacter saccharofermentans DSM 14828]